MTMRIVVMGVSGCGKTTAGEAIARRLDARFIDGDDLHPEANKAKMGAGIALTDEDRWPWLDQVGETFAESAAKTVIACSALKRSYRDRIRLRAEDVKFVFLDGSREVLAERMQSRKNHFMPLSLLDSQLATLEPLQSDEEGIRLNFEMPIEQIVDAVERLFN